MTVTAKQLRNATWHEQTDYWELGIKTFLNNVAPDIVRVAHDGKLYFRFNKRDYPNLDAVVRAYNRAEKAHRQGQTVAPPGSVESLRRRQAGSL